MDTSLSASTGAWYLLGMSCEACRGTGWVLRENSGREEVVPCPECRRKGKLQRLLKSAQIPPRYFDRGFEVYSVHHPAQELALKKAVDFVEKFPSVTRGLLFVGPCGVGKTHLSVAILKALISERGIVGRFVDEVELLRRLQYSYGPESQDTERDVLFPLMEADLLVWDDLGTGRPTEWVRDTIRMVINYRYTNSRITILTSNWPIAPRAGGSLDERVGQRLLSRILEMAEIVEMDGPDARTEIHKAGMDFSESRSNRKLEIVVPTSLLSCPQCSARKIEVLDRGPERESSSGSFLEVSCQCRACSQHFLARFFPRQASFEYLTP